MIYAPEKYNKEIIQNIDQELANLKGELEPDVAKITLAKFLYRNLGFTVELLTGIKLFDDQIINLKGMMQSNYTMCVWNRGAGKCQAYLPHTQLLTKNNGLISITELIKNIDFSQGERWIDIPETELWNGQKYVKITKTLIQPSIPAKKLKTKTGYELEGSARHLIKVWDKDKCEIVWKRYYEITTEDYICISRNNQAYSSCINDILDKKELDEAYLIGLLIGDGCLVNNGFTITSADEEILQFCEQYPVGARMHRTNNKSIQLRFKTEFSNYLKNKYNLCCKTSYFKEIPAYILKNKNLTIACLQGLFDTDGYASKKVLNVEFCSTSYQLAKQVHNLLNLFGIISKFKEKKTNSPFGKAWIINVFGKNVSLFKEQIGFRLTRKNYNIENILNKNLKLNTNLDIIPGMKQYCQREIKSKIRLPKILSDEWRHSIRRTSNQKNLSYDTLRNYRDFFVRINADHNQISKINNILDENFFFDKVESIEDLGLQNCLDFNIPNGQCYWSNGFISHNTSIAAIFAVLMCIFHPNTNILIAGPTFRTSRFIFNYIEKMTESKDGKMLLAALGVAKSKRNDEFIWKINGGSIVAIPLNGEKIRGFRANVLIIDELLLMPEELIEKVLIPYLVVPQDLKKRQKIRALEDNLIKNGFLTENKRTKFINTSKLIGLSSASYTCEYLFRKYTEFVSQIYDPVDVEEDGKYFISQMAWDAVANPSDRIDKSIIELAQSNQANLGSFKREYGAQFVDGSEGYFSMNKMIACTIPDGEEPTLLLRGGKNKKYLLSIDPNFSNSETADYFAMCVMELDTNQDGKISGTIVHNYAMAGKDLKDHIVYFHYLLTNFNIEMIIIDHLGYQFIDSANESQIFRDSNINLKIFEFISEKDGDEYKNQLREARKGYNKQMQRIVFTQFFTTDFIAKANEWLQGCIDYKKIWFASSIKGSAGAFEKAIEVPISDVVKNTITLDDGETFMNYFIDNQETLIKQTKYQCSAIEVKTTVKGIQSFDLPNTIRRDHSPSRLRKDNYTTLMLVTWLMRAYQDILTTEIQQFASFEPILI